MRENTDQNNSEYGHFSRSECYFHSAFKDYSGSSRLHNLKTHEVSETDKELLKPMNYINQYAKYGCDDCLSFVRAKTKSKKSYSPPKSNEENNIPANNEWSSDVHDEILDQETEHSEIVNTVVSLIKENELSVNHLSQIASAIGENIENLIFSSSKESVGKYKNVNETYEMNCKDL